MSLTILILVDQLNVGGTETHVLSLATQLVKEGLRVLIGTNGGPMLDTFQNAALEIVYLPFKSDNPVGDEYQELLKKCRSVLLDEKVDIIHAHFIAGLKVATALSQELLIPVVATIHGLFYPPRQLRGLLDQCPQVIAVSDPAAQWVVGKVDYPARQVAVIPNGIDTDFYVPGLRENSFREELELEAGQKLIVLVSRLTWGKTRVAEMAIRAVQELAKEYHLKLAIVGGGGDSPLIHATANLTNRLVNQDLVSVLGWRLNPVECYQAADAVIGTARVALEAMSCQTPVIAAGNASYMGPIRPENFDYAWQSYFGDHKRGRALSAEQLALDLREIFNHARITEWTDLYRPWVVRNFNISKVAQQTREFYHGVLEMRPATSLKVSADVDILDGSVKPRDIEPVPPVATVLPLAEGAGTPVTAEVPVPLGNKSTDASLLLTLKPLVSIAIPAFNRGAYLEECLDSIASQTYRPLEIVLLNDGSKDNTEDVALQWWENLKDKTGLTFVYQRQVKNTGYSSAQSAAYSLTSGDFIANQDSDDMSHPQRIERQMLFLAANITYDLVGCNFNAFRDNLANQQRSGMLRYGYEHIMETFQNGGHCISFGTLLFRRRVYERIGGLTQFLKGAEDYEWITRALNQKFYVDNLRDILYYYRNHPEQLSLKVKQERQRLKIKDGGE